MKSRKPIGKSARKSNLKSEHKGGEGEGAKRKSRSTQRFAGTRVVESRSSALEEARGGMLADFPKALQSFLGHLSGTQKSENTIRNYRLDLLSFEAFLRERYSNRPRFQLAELSTRDLELFQQDLQLRGQKSNTRRRKTLTVRRFVQYLSGRKKITIEVAKKVAAPRKVERVPRFLETSRLLEAIEKLPRATVLDRRNRVLLRILAETGCILSEVSRLRFEDFIEEGALAVRGKNARKVPISGRLLKEVTELEKKSESPWLFQGYNRAGALSTTISVRGVEMVVAHHSRILGLGDLTPRIFRHSRVVSWHREGVSLSEIQERLGLRTPYSFRVYAPLLKNNRDLSK
jgi:site-specific recombinase XerD